MQIKIRGFLLSSAMFVALSAIPLFAQTSGVITGRVSDASGAAVPSAVLTLTNVATNAVRTTQSTPSGDYTFPSVPPGVYDVKGERAGFKVATSNDIRVEVQQTVRLDIHLEVGEVSSTVEVSATADMLQTENVSVGTVMANKGVTELPLNGRNYLGLVALSANANTYSASSGQAAAARAATAHLSPFPPAATASCSTTTLWTESPTPTRTSPLMWCFRPIDAIQEFKVQTGVYPAEFGHQSTQINVVTKSGGNDYHGALFEFVRNDKFDAEPYAFTSDAPGKSPFKWNDYGFELDGPVRIPKVLDCATVCFYGDYEWKTQRQNSQGVYSVPSAAMFNGDMSELGPQFTIRPTAANGTKSTFAGNIITTGPAGRDLPAFPPVLRASNLPGLSKTIRK